MVRAGVKFYRRLLSILLAFVVAVALMVSVSVPAFASSYTYRFFDFTLDSYSFIYGKTNSLIGSVSDASLSISSVDSAYVSNLDATYFYFVQSTLSNPYMETPYLKPSFTFGFDSNMVFQPVSGFTYYQFSFDVVFPLNLKPNSVSDLSNYVYLRNSNDDSVVLGNPVNFVEVDSSDGNPRWKASFVFPVSDTYIFDELYLTFYLVPAELQLSYISYLDFYFGDIEITEANSLDFQNYVSASLGSVLSALGVSNDYLSSLVNLVTQNNVKLDSMISILNAISSSGSSINTKLNTVISTLEAISSSGSSINTNINTIISLLQTMSSSDATLAQKIEAGNQLQQIQNNLIQGDVNATTPDVIVDADVQAGDLSSAEDAIYSELGEIDFSIFDPDIMFSPVVPGFAFAGLIYKKIFDIPIVYTVTFAALILGLACAIIGRTVGRD